MPHSNVFHWASPLLYPEIFHWICHIYGPYLTIRQKLISLKTAMLWCAYPLTSRDHHHRHVYRWVMWLITLHPIISHSFSRLSLNSTPSFSLLKTKNLQQTHCNSHITTLMIVAMFTIKFRLCRWPRLLWPLFSSRSDVAASNQGSTRHQSWHRVASRGVVGRERVPPLFSCFRLFCNESVYFIEILILRWVSSDDENA